MSIFEFPAGAAAYLLFLTAVIGLVMGSFCNAWAWRMVHNESIAHGRSHCPACGHVLSPLDLVPLFSWIALKGRCRYCGAPVSKRYPITELISMLIYLSVIMRFGFTLDAIRFIITGSLLFTASLVDIDIMEIPDRMSVFLCIASLLRIAAEGVSALPSMLIGFAAVSVPLLIVVLIAEHVLKKPAMGGGDIKLIAVLGLHFGAAETLLMLIIACIVGLIAAAASHKGTGREFPFGPSIATAAWITMLCGKNVITWYLGLFGM